MRTLFALLISLSFYVSSDDHSPEEKAVLAAHAKYYAARTDRDFATMVSMESSTGVYETYSDGSFHKPGRTWSLEDYESNFPVGTSNIYFAEANKVANGAYYVRFYYEGVNGENNAPYRTVLQKPGLKKWVAGNVKHHISLLQLMVVFTKHQKAILRTNWEDI